MVYSFDIAFFCLKGHIVFGLGAWKYKNRSKDVIDFNMQGSFGNQFFTLIWLTLGK